MGIENVLLRSSLIEILITSRCIFERHDCGIHGFRRMRFVVENGHHQLPVVAQDRTLTGCESMGLGPSESNPHTQNAALRVLVFAAWVVGDIESRDSDRTAGPGNRHQSVQNDCRRFFTMAALGFKADAIDR